MDIGPGELMIVLVLVLLLFGGSKLPQLARNLGKAQREFKQALEEGKQTAASDTAEADKEPSTS